MSQVRQGAVKMKGAPKDLVGPELKPGDRAPDFECVGEGLNIIRLADTPKKARLFSVVPSLDTPVCNRQTHTFSEKLNALGDKVAAYTVSLDLPFAMKRFCGAENIQHLTNLSDVHDHSFGKNYGVLVQGLPIPLLCRAIFVVDANDTIVHAEYVGEIADDVNFDAALAALNKAAGA